jgi:DNA-binding response OmpR family regulator
MKKNIRILYVEDNSFIREEAVEYLSLLYYHVFEAQDGQEALELYLKLKPDIIITDIEMPVMNGLQLVKAIRHNNKKIPIIITTAFLDVEYLLEAVELNLVKYVVKPLTHQKLDTALALAHACLCQEYKPSTLKLSKSISYDKLNDTLVNNCQIIHLTHNEKLLFQLLIQNINKIVSYKEIENRIWKYESLCMDSLRSLLRGLRKKLESVYIKNISGVGYTLLIEKFD